MLVFISIFKVLFVNHVNKMFILVSVISSKPGMKMDYKNPLNHPARDERYSEVTKMTNHYLMIISHTNYYFHTRIIFSKIALFSFHESLSQGKIFHTKKSNFENLQLNVNNVQ